MRLYLRLRRGGLAVPVLIRRSVLPPVFRTGRWPECPASIRRLFLPQLEILPALADSGFLAGG
jgi:hypothetical protein